jgi:hypothetical protein
MAHLKIIPHHSSSDAATAHAIVNIATESEGESRPSRIRLPYRDVCKFCNDGLEAGKLPKMLWKMLWELGYEKQPEYFGTQVTYEGSEPIWHVQVYIFSPKPSEEFMRWKTSMQPLHQDVLSTLGFVMMHVKHTWSSVLAIVRSWMEQSMLISLSEQVGLLTSMSSLYMMKGTSSSRSK